MHLTIENLGKKYGKVTALQNINLSLSQGIHALIGANGAGKSTLLGIITRSISPDCGDILIDGKKIDKMGRDYFSLIGYMPQHQSFFEQMSPITFLGYMAKLKGLTTSESKRQIDDLLNITNLQQESKKRISSLSGGMKQRLMLAQALIGNPHILVLDEPTAGLDINERIRMRNFISSISKEHIIILATHISGDVEMIADDISILSEGSLIGNDTLIEWQKKMYGKVANIPSTYHNENNSMYRISAGSLPWQVVRVFRERSELFLRVVGDNLPTERLLECDRITLDDIFVYYCQRGRRYA